MVTQDNNTRLPEGEMPGLGNSLWLPVPSAGPVSQALRHRTDTKMLFALHLPSL